MMQDTGLKAKIAAAALTTCLLGLSACGGETDTPTGEDAAGDAAQVSPSGEVLGGTISDDMIPLEELTSTSPRAERSGSDAAEREEGDEGSE